MRCIFESYYLGVRLDSVEKGAFVGVITWNGTHFAHATTPSGLPFLRPKEGALLLMKSVACTCVG